MSFRINTNISAMNAQVSANLNSRELSGSLARLSSGLRINTAADDAAGLTIADSLRAQSSALGQAIKNGNDAIGIVQIADKAMDEQVKILNTIKTKASQAAQDGQSSTSRSALQSDIVKLMQELDNIASTTSYNGISLLSGNFTNKQFQIGAYSRETINVSIGNTGSDSIGTINYKTKNVLSGSGTININFTNANNTTTSISGITISHSAGTGIGVLAAAINKVTDQTGIRASFSTVSTGSGSVAAGNMTGLVLNGLTIGTINNVKANDNDGTLVNALNQYSTQTGVKASVDGQGRLSLTSIDGRGIDFSGAASTSFGALTGFSTSGTSQQLHNFGRLTLVSLGSRTATLSAGTSGLGASTGFTTESTFTANLSKVGGVFSAGAMVAMGAYANKTMSSSAPAFGASGVTTRTGAMATMDLADSAITMLNRIRADLGSTSNQITSTINNISVTQVNVAAAESQIRDVDFAEESANFSKRNILAQSGSYAMSQANAVQQNVLRLLQ